MKVTKQYLESVGFAEYKSIDDKSFDLMPYQIPFNNENDIHMREVEFNRNMFVVILTPYSEYEGIDEGYEVYVQQDAGCGFTYMHLRWSDLHIEHFEALFIAFRGHKPGNKNAELQVQDDETVLPCP